MLTPFERGLVAHLVADWIFQNDWMARNKKSLWHPAAWVHGAIHAAALWWALGWQGGLVLGLLHMLIDTRRPMEWWIRWFKRNGDSPDSASVAIWLDQVMHIGLIALWVGFF